MHGGAGQTREVFETLASGAGAAECLLAIKFDDQLLVNRAVNIIARRK
jgi:hypothetical protein